MKQLDKLKTGILPAERLVGFDLRISQRVIPTWAHSRKSEFLLRDDVEDVLSVDSQVWPSALPEATESEWRGTLGLWEDLEVMRSAARMAGVEGTVIAIALATSTMSDDELAAWATRRLVATTPTKLGTDWQLVGYDSADEWLTSGLSNCGYSAAERPIWRARWARVLNEHHLITDLGKALSFANETSQRVPEHAPFLVFALYQHTDFDEW